MINWKLERKWTNSDELIREIDIYFNSNKEISIGMLYMHLGVTKANVYDWKNQSINPEHHEWHDIIYQAKQAIKTDLAHEIKYNKKNANSQLLYMKNKFGEDWEADTKVEKEDKITINLVNLGGNKIE